MPISEKLLSFPMGSKTLFDILLQGQQEKSELTAHYASTWVVAAASSITNLDFPFPAKNYLQLLTPLELYPSYHTINMAFTMYIDGVQSIAFEAAMMNDIKIDSIYIPTIFKSLRFSFINTEPMDITVNLQMPYILFDSSYWDRVVSPIQANEVDLINQLSIDLRKNNTVGI